MHLCDYSKTGQLLPGVLPIDLHPQRSRASSTITQSTSPEVSSTIPAQTQDLSPTVLKNFEDKRKENFDRGNAVLEAKRQMLREQEEREKREREEKERVEQEKRQRLKDEQERRRLAEIEKQIERQRLSDMQREEERKKVFEQREKARNELIRQQRLEWEKQKKQELESMKLKLQEQLSSLKARDKNLEFDMQSLNDKISSYKTKIHDGQQNLSDFNTRLDTTRKSNVLKQNECEILEKELKEYTNSLNRLSQEKLSLNEQLKSLNQDNPFAEEYRHDAGLLKTKEALVNQLRVDLDRLEAQINAARTQLELAKKEFETTKADEIAISKENNRLAKQVDSKRNNTTAVLRSATPKGT